MATKLTWIIHCVDRNPNTGAIEVAHWRVNGVDDADDTLTGTNYGTHNIPKAPKGAAFVAYEDVTEAQVLEWCFNSGLDKTACEAIVQAQIDAMRTPALVSGTPWE